MGETQGNLGTRSNPGLGWGKEKGIQLPRQMSLQMSQKRDGIPWRWGGAETWLSVRTWCLRKLPEFDQVEQKAHRKAVRNNPRNQQGQIS